MNTKIWAGDREVDMVAVGMPDGTVGYLPPASAATYTAMLQQRGGLGQTQGGGNSSFGQVVALFADGAQLVIDAKTYNDIKDARKQAKREQKKVDALQDRLKAALANVTNGTEVAKVLTDIFAAAKKREQYQLKALRRTSEGFGVGALASTGRLLGKLTDGQQGSGYGGYPALGGGGSQALAIGGAAVAAVAVADLWKDDEDEDEDDDE